MATDATKDIIEYIKKHPLQSSREIHDNLGLELGYATIKRVLNQLLSEKLISTKGKGKATRYVISPAYELLHSINVESYFEKEQEYS
jgi:predicted transcriptional regulator